MKTVHLVGKSAHVKERWAHNLGRIHHYDGGIDFVSEDSDWAQCSGGMTQDGTTLRTTGAQEKTLTISRHGRKILVAFDGGTSYVEFFLTKESARDYLASMKKP